MLYQYTLISVSQPSLLGLKIQYLNHNHNESIDAAIYSRAHDSTFNGIAAHLTFLMFLQHSRRNTQQYVDT